MTTWPYPVRLDSQVELCGVYSDPNTTWTLPFNAEDAGIDTIVLSSVFGSDAGTILNTGLTVSGTSVSVAGDYSAGRVILGRAYDMDLQLTQPFVRDQRNLAILRHNLRLQRVIVRHLVGGDYQVIGERSDVSNQGATFTAPAKTVASEGEHKAQVRGLAEKTTLKLKASGPRPSVLTSVRLDYHPSPH